ncbi:cytochrome P450 alkane hydroxylase-like protein [Pleomassaria siparia CBS 279.74]|uniref:Cytochrome P450 alkane hydroxylase-like protein n=1 Tax=Pleomassaria siparia CBS 279.74 TaxID=1314801 RepID=A0A6G1KFD8_9PLEO|nr:cytochrome P450 alkane hydroxylase-like protein [Pleomassaria siparia CBS 279.74]
MTTMLETIRPYLTTPYILLALFSIFIAKNQINKFQQNRRISRLGARAPLRTTYLPYGIDFIVETLSYMVKDMNLDIWRHTFNKYGNGGYTIEMVGAERILLTAEPENIKAILATQFKAYGKGAAFHDDWHEFLGDSIFTTDGDQWHNSRQLIRPQFIKDRVSDLDIFEEHSQTVMELLGGNREVNFLDVMFRYTLDAATHFLLGRSVNSLAQPQVAFANAFSNVQRVQSFVARVGALNWAIPRRRMGFYSSLKIVDDFLNQYVEEALSLSAKELEKKTSHDQGYTFLHSIAAHTRNRKMLRDQLIAVLLAGRDTTACTLSWTIYELSLHPEVVAKLRQEIIEHIGLERPPTYQNLKDMKYLQHIMNETLRLYPSVPFNVRLALTDTTLPTGGGPDGTLPIGILKDTPIGYSTLLMQRRADLYPPPESGFPDVETFVPERWDSWTPKSWTYVPFNGGPRLCVGQQFALTEMGYTLVRLFQRFQGVENRMNGEAPGLHADIVLQPGKPLKVAFF